VRAVIAEFSIYNTHVRAIIHEVYVYNANVRGLMTEFSIYIQCTSQGPPYRVLHLECPVEGSHHRIPSVNNAHLRADKTTVIKKTENSYQCRKHARKTVSICNAWITVWNTEINK
jgi:hypothetical protein